MIHNSSYSFHISKCFWFEMGTIMHGLGQRIEPCDFWWIYDCSEFNIRTLLLNRIKSEQRNANSNFTTKFTLHEKKMWSQTTMNSVLTPQKVSKYHEMIASIEWKWFQCVTFELSLYLLFSDPFYGKTRVDLTHHCAMNCIKWNGAKESAWLARLATHRNASNINANCLLHRIASHRIQ